MTRILHVSRRPLNGHPGWLSELQNRHGWQSKTCLVQTKETGRRPYPADIKSTDRGALKEWVSGCNVVHFHGDLTMADPFGTWIKQLLNPKTQVIQQHYHERTLLEYKVRTRKIEAFEYEVMIAKKGAILDPGLPLVPVVIPTWMPELAPVVRRRDRLKLVYTPTSQDRLMNYRGSKGKGYYEIKAVLDEIKNIDCQILYDVNWRETMNAVREADIRLDECVTGGYGIATLEGLAAGCIVIGGCCKQVMDLLGPQPPPYFCASMNSLREIIWQVASIPWSRRHEIQNHGIKWMAEHHNEDMVFNAYKKVYEEGISKTGMSKEELVSDVNRKVYSCTIKPFVEPPAPDVFPNKGGKLIVQIARTNCAGAIWHIHDAINKYTPHTCRTITMSEFTNDRRFHRDILLSEKSAVAGILSRADVIHFHNNIDHDSHDLKQYRSSIAKAKKFLQLHTEPLLIQRMFHKNIVTRNDIKTLVIAQKHARFYPNSTRVPNIIDINDPMLTPSDRKWLGGKLKVIYTPSDKKSYNDYSKTCCGKGYEETIPVLRRLEDEGLIEVTIITDMTWEELMPIKRQHDVCIDECVTGGYHLCSLEALSQGLVTVAWIDDKTKEAIASVTGNTDPLPWINTRCQDLYENLKALAKSSPENIQKIKSESRKWMERNWDTRKLINNLIRIYGVEEEKPVEKHLHRNWGFSKLLPVYDVPGRLEDDALKLEGAWKDKRVIIWGNGCTVTEALAYKGEKWFAESIHIGTNCAALLGLDFSAYCVGDLRFFKEQKKGQMAIDAPGIKIFQSFIQKAIPPDFTGISYVKTLGGDGFCSDLKVGVYHGYSVVWLALQIAIWGGAKDILLAGCPHDYSGQPRFYSEETPAPIDNNLQHILRNYSTIVPLFQSMGVSLKTIGKSRLNSVGVEEMLTPGIY